MVNPPMRRSLLLKVLVLTTALSGVTAVIYLSVRGFAGDPGRPGQPTTFFSQFVVAGGPIVWFILLPLSFIAVYFAAEHFLTIRRRELLPEGTANSIAGTIRQFGLGQLEARLAGRGDLVSVAAAKAVSGGRGDWFRIRNLLAESLQDQAAALLRRIEWLNLIGNVSPMVGLFGTVYGMIMLFHAIVLAGGQPQPIQLADGISVALVTTFWGLLIAIPAVGIHGVFRNRIEALINDAVVAAEGIMPEIKRGLERQQRAEAQRAAKADHRVEDYRDKSAHKIDEILPAR